MNSTDTTRSNGSRFATAMIALVALGASPAAPANPSVSDAEIQSAIRNELVGADGKPLTSLSVSAQAGLVDLSGQAPHLFAREQAVEVARSIEGVLSVIDRITIPPLQTDVDALRLAILERLAKASFTELNEILVEVQTGGIVHLHGSVDSWAERNLALQTTKTVRGVAAVRSHLTVHASTTRPDGEIAEEIRGLLDANPRVRSNLIEVRVHEGVVTLRGFVGTHKDRQLAARTADVVGVEDIDTRQLRFRPWADSPMHREGPLDPSDQEIESALRAAIRMDPRVDADHITIEMKSATVQLRGKVADLEARLAAEEDARNTHGVLRVVNELVVESATLRTEPSL